MLMMFATMRAKMHKKIPLPSSTAPESRRWLLLIKLGPVVPQHILRLQLSFRAPASPGGAPMLSHYLRVPPQGSPEKQIGRETDVDVVAAEAIVHIGILIIRNGLLIQQSVTQVEDGSSDAALVILQCLLRAAVHLIKPMTLKAGRVSVSVAPID
jgi:hypothetical protein